MEFQLWWPSVLVCLVVIIIALFAMGTNKIRAREKDAEIRLLKKELFKHRVVSGEDNEGKEHHLLTYDDGKSWYEVRRCGSPPQVLCWYEIMGVGAVNDLHREVTEHTRSAQKALDDLANFVIARGGIGRHGKIYDEGLKLLATIPGVQVTRKVQEIS